MGHPKLTDIQFTDRLDGETLVREINQRLRGINSTFVSVERDLRMLAFLATTKSFEVEYRQAQDIDVFVSTLDIYITALRFRAPGGNMTVVPGISAGGVGAFTPILLDPDIPLSAIPVTSTAATYDTLGPLVGGNAAMSADDVFQVQTTNGTVGNPLFITVKFDIIGLSNDPAVRAVQHAEATVAIR